MTWALLTLVVDAGVVVAAVVTATYGPIDNRLPLENA